jgi:hypothetical protein
MRKLATISALWILLGCSGRMEPTERVYLCDHTTSAHCDEQSVRKAARGSLKAPVPGDRFTVLSVACTSDQVETLYETIVPTWGGGVARKRRAWIEAEEEHLESLHLRRQEHCSGIVGSIWRASRLLQESKRPIKVLIINSDLREVSAELGFNFEKAIPAPDVFVTRIKEKNLLPDLHGVTVTLSGVHDEVSPDSRRWTSQQSTALRAAWSEAFRAMGVSGVEFRNAAPMENPESDNHAWGLAK